MHGVYRMYFDNEPNPEMVGYIGSAAGKKGFRAREKHHRKQLAAGKYPAKFQEAYNQFGAEHLQFEPLLETPAHEALALEREMGADLFREGRLYNTILPGSGPTDHDFR